MSRGKDGTMHPMKGEIKSNFHDAITNTKALLDCFLVCCYMCLYKFKIFYFLRKIVSYHFSSYFMVYYSILNINEVEE